MAVIAAFYDPTMRATSANNSDMVRPDNDAANARSISASAKMSPIPSKVVSRITYPEDFAHVPPAPGLGPVRTMRAARISAPVMKRVMVPMMFCVRERGNGGGEQQDRGGDDVSHGRIFPQLILSC
jgi:hypothetical protein